MNENRPLKMLASGDAGVADPDGNNIGHRRVGRFNLFGHINNRCARALTLS